MPDRKFIKDTIPPEHKITKQEILKRSLHTHDVVLQRAEEFAYQLKTVKSKNVQELGTAIGELIKMNEQMTSKLVEAMHDTKKDLQEMARQNMENVQSMITSHLDQANKLMNQRNEYHLKETERIIEKARKDLEQLSNSATTNIVQMFEEHKKFVTSRLYTQDEAIPVKSQREVEKLLSDFIKRTDNLERQMVGFTTSVEGRMNKFQETIGSQLASAVKNFDSIKSKFYLLSKELSS